MGQLYSIAKILARGFLSIIQNLFVANWFRLPFIALLLFGSFTAGASTSYAQVCSLADVQSFNTNLAATGRNGADVLEIDFNSFGAISCAITNGRANNAPDNRARISHCTSGNPEDLCFIANTAGNLSNVQLSEAGGPFVSTGDNAQVDLSAGVYNAVATVDLVPVSFSFTVQNIASDTDQRLFEADIVFTPTFPTISIANTTNGTEPGTDGLLTVTQTATLATDTVLSYSVAGTATAGTDYTALSGTVTILAGDTTATIPVPVLDDAEVEGNETVTLTLTAVTSGLPTLGAALVATNTIGDDDAATLSIANTTDGTESGTNGVLTVTQSAVSLTDTDVTYTVAGTATIVDDYSLSSGGTNLGATGTLTIPAGATSVTVSVSAVDDAIVEGDETVIVTLTGVTGSATLGGTVTATNTIIDDDAEINSRVSQAFHGQVHNYVSRRMRFQSRSSPSIHRNPNSGTPADKNLNGNIDLSGNENGTSGSFSFTNSFDVTGTGCDNCNNPYFWAEAEFAYFRDRGRSDTAIQTSGNYYIGYAGLSLPLDERLTVGIMGQIDRFEDDLDNGLGQASGTGWAIGPYFSAKVLDELNLDVRGLWGRSNNKAIQSVLGSEYSGSFDTERWIVEGILSGRHSVDDYSFVPSARIFYMNENWDDYTVSDGNRAVSVGGDSAEIGNLSAALEIIKTVKSAEYVVETFVSGEIYWDFQDPGIIDSTGAYIQNDDFSASISAGIGIDNENSSLRLEATYGGFGDDSLESLGGSISLSHKF